MKTTLVYPLRLLFSSLLLFFLPISLFGSLFGQGTVEMELSDSDSSAPISARMSFTKSPKKVVRPRKLLQAGEQWLAEENFPLSLPNGEYEFLVERGPEFKVIRGGFTIESKAKDVVTVEVPRSVDMHAEGWYSGDHLSTLLPTLLKQWQAADALDVAISVAPNQPASETAKPKKPIAPETPDNDAIGLQLTLNSQRVEWQHGAFLLHSDPSRPTNHSPPDKANEQTDAEVTPKPDSLPSITDTAQVLQHLSKIKEDGSWIELLNSWQRDTPFLLATDQVRAVQILSEGNRPGSDVKIAFPKSKAGKFLEGKVPLVRGKERSFLDIFAPIPADDDIRFNNARGLGSLSEFLYWQMLEAGFRIAPTAGSCFDANNTNLGYNRVYVFTEEPPTPTTWMQNVRQGRTTVTNGPLLRTTVNGQPPGSVLASYRGQSVSLDIAVSLTVREPVDYLDVVFNGKTIYSAKLEDHYKKGEFPPIEIEESGWMVVRVVTGHDQGYRLATTAPFYFEFDSQPRRSKAAVEFFETWLSRSIDAIKKDKEQNVSLEPFLESTRRFWSDRLETCTAD